MKYINFNNAGSSLPFEGVSKVINKFLEFEKIYGGYYAAEKFEKNIDTFYSNISKLINCKPNEISFLPSTTIAWNFFFNSIKVLKSQNIIILDNEYGSNLIFFKNNNYNIKIVKILRNGQVCFSDLRKKIDKNTKFVCICHIASQCGNIIDVEQIGIFVKKINPDILYVVDACQSVGHINVDVKKIGCDVLVSSGRKYLRGPRGTGFIYVKKYLQNSLKPLILDLKNAYISKKNVKLKKNRIFENFEYSPALKLGLSNAIEKINSFDINKIELNIKKKSLFFRKKLRPFSEITFFENEKCISGINTLRIKGISSLKIYKYLLQKKILTSISTKAVSDIYFEKHKIKDILRISIHHYNKQKEINYLIKCLIDLIKKKVMI